VIRPIMRLTLAADHQMVDGAMAARFMANLKARLEAPLLLPALASFGSMPDKQVQREVEPDPDADRCVPATTLSPIDGRARRCILRSNLVNFSDHVLLRGYQ